MRSVPSFRAVSAPPCGGTTARGPHPLPDDGDSPGTTDGVEDAAGTTNGIVLGEVGSTRAPDQSQAPATIPASSHPPTSASVGPRGVAWPVLRDRICTLLAVAFLDRGKAGGLAAGILIVMYLLNILAALSPDMADLGRVSAFRYFDLKALIDAGTYPIGDSLLYLAVAVGGWLLALWAFRGRDLAA